MSNIIEFPVREELAEELASCFDCVNHASGPLGSFCVYWREPIVDDTVAVACGTFEKY